MSKPFDAAAKTLLEINPKDWIDYLGIKAEHVEVIDGDIATVTANADKVIRVKARKPWLVNVEFLSWSDPNIGESCLDYLGQFWPTAFPVKFGKTMTRGFIS